jgi:formylglycine-generating enzyme required for sulfatase activity
MPQSSFNQFSGIFVCYRRDDSSGHAGRLSDNLIAHFGDDRIFMDIDTIEPGEDFVTVIENAVASCAILIAIIGKHWLSAPGETSRCLDDPNDFVRLEIATALKRDIRVIPLLVQGATMPKPQDLPDDLTKLSRRNALELSDLRWRHDVEQLINALERILVKREESVRLAEATRRDQDERERRETEERQRVEVEAAQHRLAEEQEKQIAVAERQREEEERERTEAKERARRVAQEVSRRRAEEERAQAETDSRRRAEEEAERRRAEAEEQTQRRRIVAATQARADEEGMRLEAEEAEHRRFVNQNLRTTHEQKQTKVDLSAIPTAPSFEPVWKPPVSQAIADIAADIAEAITLRRQRGKRTTSLIIIASIAILGIVALIWMKHTAEEEQRPAGRDATTESNQQATPTASASQTIPQLPPGMVYVSGGEFMMGLDKRFGGDEYSSPAHRVKVKPFFIDTYEVACEDYKKCVDAGVCQPPQGWSNGHYQEGTARQPVTGVDWNAANTYAKWAGKRLPTEEEWEFAARGTDGRLYPWGNNWQQGLANANGEAQGLANVDKYNGKSPFGAIGMVGNAWEWTASAYKSYLDGSIPKDIAGKNPKVIRGGMYESVEGDATAIFRRGWPASGNYAYGDTGFRCAKDVMK